MSPVASADGAVATQGVVNEGLGRDALDALADGQSLESAVETLLRADPDADRRQIHGVDRNGAVAVTGEACNDWCGHRETDAYTVAGTHLTGEAVLDAVADAYEQAAPGGSTADPLAGRLVDALAAGRRAGGDRRDDLPVRSAALVVARTEDLTPTPYYEDLRVDASETPIRDLRETFEQARRGYRQVLEKYAADDGTTGGSGGPAAVDDADRDSRGADSSEALDADALAEFVDATAPDALAESIRPADLVTGAVPTDEARGATDDDATGETDDEPRQTGKERADDEPRRTGKERADDEPRRTGDDR
jgi:uncharacterized Ntn-hydrolase superfamily protein